jgi:hypothetical protein
MVVPVIYRSIGHPSFRGIIPHNHTGNNPRCVDIGYFPLIRNSERIQVSLEAVLDGKAGICDIVFIAVPFFEAIIYHIIGIRSTLILCNKACFADTSLEKHG